MILDELIQKLGSSNPYEVDDATHALVHMGEAAVEPLITAMLSDNRRIGWQAVKVLGQIPDPRWLQPMRSILIHAHPLVGQAAVTALMKHDPRILMTLCRTLPFANHMVQLSIITAMETLGNRAAIPVLMQTLMKAESPALRYTIIQALGNLHAIEAINLIASFTNDPDAHVRKRVQTALQKLGRLSAQ